MEQEGTTDPRRAASRTSGGRRYWWVAFAIASLMATMMVAASPANGACYFANGSCATGFLVGGQTTPWTGNYFSTTEYMQNYSSSNRTLAIGIRACTGCAGTVYSSGGPVYRYDLIGPRASRQRWCRNAGAYNGYFQCGFTDSGGPV